MNEDGYMNNGIRVSYPRTKYLKLNLVLDSAIRKIILEFMDYAKEAVQTNFIYTLDITYDDYSYRDFLSFVFFVSMSTGGAHPDNRIFSITYNIVKDSIVTIQNLVEQEPHFLKLASDESRRILARNVNITDPDMLLQGTAPNYDNFKNFAYTPVGLKFYFPPYQVAPYSSGSFQVVIPYEKIFVSKN